MSVLQKPLSSREIDRLDRFLLSNEALEESMDIAMLDGYLCAVLSGPNLIMPSEWMGWVWDAKSGEQGPEFESEKEAQEILNLLIRHANEIADTLTGSRHDYEPMFYLREVDDRTVRVVDEWCCGYVKGMSLDAIGWQSLCTERPEWFEVINLYGTEAGWGRLKDLVDKHADSIDRHEAFVDRIVPAVRNIHAYWLEKRSDVTPLVMGGTRQPIRKAAIPGRNDPCPCGSGKKFKRCHGAPGLLH